MRYFKTRFKRRATAIGSWPNSIDRIKFDFSTAVARRFGKACRAKHGSSTTWFQTSRYCRAELNS